MFIHNIDPVLFSVGSLEIRYYGLIYALGFVVAYFMINYLATRREMGLTTDDVADFLVYLIIGNLVGARLFYVIFYNFKFFLTSPLSIFAIWQGGLSFHSGLVGASIASLYFCRKKKISFYSMADIVVVPLAFGLMFGRIANFINGELVGRVTNVPWCFKFDGYEGCRHPSQLYASAKDFVIFSTLWFLKDKKWKEGTFFWLFVLMYGLLRFIVGFYRAPDPQVGFVLLGLTMGQLLNISMVVIGSVMLKKVIK
jgi:phosphatidylglycerol---prolipoprotein diacylglyceryl transferase